MSASTELSESTRPRPRHLAPGSQWGTDWFEDAELVEWSSEGGGEPLEPEVEVHLGGPEQSAPLETAESAAGPPDAGGGDAHVAQATPANRAAHPGRMLTRAGRLAVRTVSWLLVGLMVLLAGMSVALTIATHRSPNGQYRAFGHPVYSVLSGSMTPTIRTGDLVVDDVVTPVQAASLHVGQIITFSSPSDRSEFFTHRIVAVRHSRGGAVSYVTKGDANNAPDAAPIPSTAVVGLYSGKVPFGAYVLNALHKPAVLALLILSLLLALLSSSLLGIARSADRRQTSGDRHSASEPRSGAHQGAHTRARPGSWPRPRPSTVAKAGARAVPVLIPVPVRSTTQISPSRLQHPSPLTARTHRSS